MATWNSSSSNSANSQKYKLDESDQRDILVYRYRHGLAVESQSSLSKILDKNPNLRCSRKEIPRGDSRIEVRQEDLYNEPEKSEYSKYPNSKTSLASIGLPSPVYWRRLLLNQFKDLYIVSPETSPNTSPNSSQHVSPSDTYPAATNQTKQDGQEMPSESA
jgi:hypothetical protein